MDAPLTYLKIRELAGGNILSDINMGDSGKPGTLTGPGCHLIEARSFTFGHEFHPPVTEVVNPAGQFQFPCLFPG